MMPYDPITVGGVQYISDGNVCKQGKRLPLYLQNQVDARFVIKSDAYNSSGERLLGYVAIYIHEEDRRTDKYFKWWQETIQPLEN